jgi:ribosome-binding protein aMBF1 (putative translation factor)
MAKRLKFTDQIRQAIADCGVSRYRISQETGVAESVLSKFLRGQIGFNLETLDKLADYLQFELKARGPKER